MCCSGKNRGGGEQEDDDQREREDEIDGGCRPGPGPGPGPAVGSDSLTPEWDQRLAEMVGLGGTGWKSIVARWSYV